MKRGLKLFKCMVSVRIPDYGLRTEIRNLFPFPFRINSGTIFPVNQNVSSLRKELRKVFWFSEWKPELGGIDYCINNDFSALAIVKV